jgi:long-chain acyl-CoA synthetase
VCLHVTNCEQQEATHHHSALEAIFTTTMIDKLVYILALPVFLLDIVLYLISFVVGAATKKESKKTKDGLYSVTRGNATETHGAPRSSSNGALLVTYMGCETVYEMIQASVQKYGANRVAMQNRKFVDLKKLKESDRFPSKVFDDKAGFETITYEELGEKLKNFGAGLRGLGMTPIPQHDPNDFENVKGDFNMVIFEDTCAEWTIALHGALSQSMTVATCYATLGHDAVVLAVQETDAAALFVNWSNVESFAKRASEMPSLKAIIASTNEMPQGTSIYRPPKGSKLKVATFDEVVDSGKENSYDVTPPKVRGSSFNPRI